MTPEQLLKLSSKAGKILLESGAEIQRTEDTICRLCEAFGVDEASAFVIPTGMFLSFSYQGNTYSKIMRIRSSSLNLEKINLVNELSRRCERNVPFIEEALDELDRIEHAQEYSWRILRIAGGMIAAFFTIYFGGGPMDACFAFFIGCLTQYCVQVFEYHQINFIVKITCTSVVLTFVALILQTFGLIHNLDSAIIGSLMLLVPGLAITNAVRDSIGGDLLAGIIRAIEACLIAIAIALGAGITMSIWLPLFGGA
ncbi:threonine/serine exporter family protein [Merdibacter massiliensis]|uniref:threonine/serine exporter family protein n=1 Tax=Merdibacter massiliensis TaxID=1871030 RepID=UPI00096A923B|nr:threonine/serine exporter family protein [Merdibacter massiliensis]